MSVCWNADGYEPEYLPDDGHVYTSVMELAVDKVPSRLASTRAHASRENAPLLMFPPLQNTLCETFDETDTRALLAHGVQSIERAAQQMESEREPYDINEMLRRLETARRRLRHSQKRTRPESAMRRMKRVFSMPRETPSRPHLRKI